MKIMKISNESNYSPQKNNRTIQEKLKRELKTKAEINNMEKRGIFKAKKEIRFSKKLKKIKNLKKKVKQNKKIIYKLQVQEQKGNITIETKFIKRIMRD